MASYNIICQVHWTCRRQNLEIIAQNPHSKLFRQFKLDSFYDSFYYEYHIMWYVIKFNQVVNRRIHVPVFMAVFSRYLWRHFQDFPSLLDFKCSLQHWTNAFLVVYYVSSYICVSPLRAQKLTFSLTLLTLYLAQSLIIKLTSKLYKQPF